MHEFLVTLGGAERVLSALLELYPEADIYTLIYEEETLGKMGLNGARVKASFLQKFPVARKFMLPLFPLAIESFDLSGYDLVISSSNSFAKNVITNSGALHICYCHAPMRFAWDWTHEYLRENKPPLLLKPLIQLSLHLLRIWDHAGADRVDEYVANSWHTAKKIEKYYRRKSVVIYPPVDTEGIYLSQERGKYFLIVSRLSAYKKIDLAVKAFMELGLPLTIAGTGADEKRLKELSAGAVGIRFMGRVEDSELPKLFSGARALVFPGEDDFGIVPVEAMAAGRAVIAFGVGGALETVVGGKTGVFFKEESAEALVAAVKEFLHLEESFKAIEIRARAEEFSKTKFKASFKEFVEQKIKELNENKN